MIAAAVAGDVVMLAFCLATDAVFVHVQFALDANPP